VQISKDSAHTETTVAIAITGSLHYITKTDLTNSDLSGARMDYHSMSLAELKLVARDRTS